MKLRHIIGMVACLALLASCFMHWAWYPDIQKYFTGFYSEKNYYGKPGYLLSVVAFTGMAAYALRRVWLNRLNLIFAGLGLGYAIKSYLLFTSGYDGYKPAAQMGLYLMLIAMALHLVMAARCINETKTAKGADPETKEV